MNTIYWPMLILLLLFCSTCGEDDHNYQEEAEAIRSSAVQWLVKQQGEDGGWHSQTHGILKGGVAFTAYIADALAESTDTIFSQELLNKAILFLYRKTEPNGAVGYSNEYVLEYPIYATAYTLKLWPLLNPMPDTTISPILTKFLRSQQFAEHRGITPEHRAYGAWGFGELDLPYGKVGHVDLSHTRRVLEALSYSSLDNDHPCWQQVSVFLDRIQNDDGGFCSSSYTLGANKADDQDHKCVSYATATADGLLALLSLPQPARKKVEAAAGWLLQNESWDYPSGIKPNQPGNWGKVLFFYHLSVRAKAYRELEERGLLPHPNLQNWRQEVIAAIRNHQSAEGSFSNPWGAPNKEDDPLLATALVVRALNAVLEKSSSSAVEKK